MVRQFNLSIIILSFNVRNLLDDCLRSLYVDPDSKKWQVMVVDNASTDDTVKWLRRNYSQVKLIVAEKDLGFSAGNNLAVQDINAPYTLFLNPDTVVPVGTITHVLNYLKQNSTVGAATCKVVLANGDLDYSCHRGFPTPWNAICYFSGLSKLFSGNRWFTGYALEHLDLDEEHEVEALTGAFMMLPTKLGRKLNWWDEDYFWNGEDLDFCYRIKQIGLKIMYLPEKQIIHFKGASAGYKSTSHGKNRVSREMKVIMAKASTQAMRIFYRKHYLNQYPRVVTWMILSGIKLLEKYRVAKIL